MRYEVMVMAEIHVSGTGNEYFTTLSVAHGYVAYLIHFLHERINKNENLILRWLNAVPPSPTFTQQH